MAAAATALAPFHPAVGAWFDLTFPGGLADETAVVYVSPLKALSNDIRLNLDAPLAITLRAVLYRDGTPVGTLVAGRIEWLVPVDRADEPGARDRLIHGPSFVAPESGDARQVVAQEPVGVWEGVAFAPESREARRVFRSIPVGIDRVAQRRIAAFLVRTHRAADDRAHRGVAPRGHYPWY